MFFNLLVLAKDQERVNFPHHVEYCSNFRPQTLSVIAIFPVIRKVTSWSDILPRHFQSWTTDSHSLIFFCRFSVLFVRIFQLLLHWNISNKSVLIWLGNESITERAIRFYFFKKNNTSKYQLCRFVYHHHHHHLLVVLHIHKLVRMHNLFFSPSFLEREKMLPWMCYPLRLWESRSCLTNFFVPSTFMITHTPLRFLQFLNGNFFFSERKSRRGFWSEGIILLVCFSSLLEAYYNCRRMFILGSPMRVVSFASSIDRHHRGFCLHFFLPPILFLGLLSSTSEQYFFSFPSRLT